MSYQVLIIPHSSMEAAVKYAKLKTSSHYNECMFKHYRHLYYKHRRGWRFWKGALAFLKMIRYERAMYQARVDELLDQLKKDGNDGINITA